MPHASSRAATEKAPPSLKGSAAGHRGLFDIGMDRETRVPQREGFGHLLNLVGYTAIKDTGIFSVKTKVVPVFTVPVLNSPIF